MLDCHDTHCCIDHGCKYGDDDCPVENGLRKQTGPCENCGLETEGYYGEPERTPDEQQHYVDMLWDKKHGKKVDPNFDLYEMSVMDLRNEVIRLRNKYELDG